MANPADNFLRDEKFLCDICGEEFSSVTDLDDDKLRHIHQRTGLEDGGRGHRGDMRAAGLATTPVQDILQGQTEGIILTADIKNQYIADLEKKCDSIRSEFEDAHQTLRICDYIETKKEFYVRDHPITYYFDQLSNRQFDSLYQI